MTIPRADDLFLPLLRYAEPRPFVNSEAVEALAAELQLTKEERAKFSGSGKVPEFDNHIHWASGQLRMAELFSKEDGSYHITDRGRQVLANPPPVLDRRFLATFPEYVLATNGRAKLLEEKDSEQILPVMRAILTIEA